VDLLCKKSLTRIKGIFVPEDLINEQGLTPLHIAAAHGCDAAVIQRLLDGSGRHIGW
jgi:predicted flap endonuclease-1-like 5' DNA nuclease